MLRRRLYYIAKPYLPWRLRMLIRRVVARRKLRACRDLWPILDSAGVALPGWPGWPDGKRFAFVITHDVEGPDGLEKCRRLAELELQFGFRSSFNFIPEGSYSVPADLRAWLAENGFEVGVHDLHHDGKLFDSKSGFEARARRINHYLQDWKAVGFRAGFMLRNLDWYHQLKIQYDASTFDTDPFEPMPDGAGTIFPFWVNSPAAGEFTRPAPSAGPATASSPSSDSPRSSASSSLPPSSQSSAAPSLSTSRSGYVELPYTLPQDSTLFFVLGQQSPSIWLRKLDWIAERGGMALINVHPDYLRLGNEKPRPNTFPVEFYLELLRHIRAKHEGKYWQPLPRQIATWYKRGHLPDRFEVISAADR